MEQIFHNENPQNKSPLSTPAENQPSQEREDVTDFELTTTDGGDYYFRKIFSDGSRGPELHSGISGSVDPREARNMIAKSLGLPGEQ